MQPLKIKIQCVQQFLEQSFRDLCAWSSVCQGWAGRQTGLWTHPSGWWLYSRHYPPVQVCSTLLCLVLLNPCAATSVNVPAGKQLPSGQTWFLRKSVFLGSQCLVAGSVSSCPFTGRVAHATAGYCWNLVVNSEVVTFLSWDYCNLTSFV